MRVLSVSDERELGILQTKSSPIEKIDDSTIRVVDNMVTVLEQEETVSISAVQLGHCIRAFVINMFCGLFDGSKDVKVVSGYHALNGRNLVCINPKIISFSGENVVMFEGCLSAKSYGLIGINRPSHVDLQYTDLMGNECVVRTYNWLARCIQHEMDHLNGVLLSNIVDNIKNKNAKSVSEEDYSSVHILLVEKKHS